jgi:hypothetical protein
MFQPFHHLRFEHSSNIWQDIYIIKLLITALSSSSYYFHSSYIQTFSSPHCSQTPSLYFLLHDIKAITHHQRLPPKQFTSSLPSRTHGSEVGIANGHGLNDQEIRVQVVTGWRILISPYCPDWLPVHPPSYQMGARAVSPGVKWPGWAQSLTEMSTRNLPLGGGG